MLRNGVALLFLVGACSGDDDTGPEPIGPETCDNGVDDNGNGLVDCDDKAYCGGIQCIPTGDDDDDDTTEPPEVEIDFDGSTLDFSFTPQAGICSQPIRTITVVNRNEDVEALVDANCDLVGDAGTSAIGFDIDGQNPRAFIVDETLPAATSIEVGMIFACRGIDEPFSTNCRIKVDLSGLVDEATFTANGTPL
jgi:hypothetical protein